MFNSSSISSGLEFSWINYTSIYKNSEIKVFKNINLDGISNNWPDDLFETQVYKTREFYW